MENLIAWLSTAGLSLGAIGAFGLALLTKVFITINPDGTQSWGPPHGVDNGDWQRRNRRLRVKQKYGLPLSYCALATGFVLQLIALWLGVLAK